MEAFILQSLSHRGHDRVYQLFFGDLVLGVNIGVLDREKTAPQRVALEVQVFLAEPGSTADHIDSVLDYDVVHQAIAASVAEGHIELQETLLRRLLDRLMAHEQVLAAVVSSNKLDIYPDCAVGCRMHRVRA